MNDNHEQPIVFPEGVDNAITRNKTLRVLQKAYGEEAVSKWCASIVERVQQAEILRQGVHEKCVQNETESWDKLDDGSLPRPTIIAEWLLRDLRKQQECGCPSYRWESTKQRFIELDAAVPELPLEGSPSSQDLLNMWEKGERLRILREALSAFQEVRKSVCGKWEGGDGMKSVSSVVRRLTPL